MNLYVLGIQRGGTTLLASLLGAHSDINMLFQSTSGDRLIGKKYQGNKLCVYHDIRWNTKSSRLRNFLFFKTAFLFRKFKNYHELRPSSRLTIPQLFTEEDKIIIIHRNAIENIKSLSKRTGMSTRLAEVEYDNAYNILSKIKYSYNCYVTSLHKLTTETEKVLREICQYLELKYEHKMLQGYKYMHVYDYNKIVEKW